MPTNQIVGLLPGEVFVHRNVANLVGHTDLNCLSVIQYAVEVPRVRHFIGCGHYDCSGVSATLNRDRVGLVDTWLRHVEDVRQKHLAQIGPEAPFDQRCAVSANSTSSGRPSTAARPRWCATLGNAARR